MDVDPVCPERLETQSLDILTVIYIIIITFIYGGIPGTVKLEFQFFTTDINSHIIRLTMFLNVEFLSENGQE